MVEWKTTQGLKLPANPIIHRPRLLLFSKLTLLRHFSSSGLFRAVPFVSSVCLLRLSPPFVSSVSSVAPNRYHTLQAQHKCSWEMQDQYYKQCCQIKITFPSQRHTKPPKFLAGKQTNLATFITGQIGQQLYNVTKVNFYPHLAGWRV